MERKEFLLSLGLGAGSLLVSCCLGGCSKSGNDDNNTGGNPPPTPGTKVDFTFDTTADNNLKTAGWTIKNNVIIAKSGTEYLAFESVCPHQSALLTYNASSKTFPCSNATSGHGSVFDDAGKRIAGPARRDLKKFQTQVSGNNLRVFE